MSTSHELAVGAGYSETQIHQQIVSLHVFPREDLSLNLPTDKESSVSLLKSNQDNYKASLEIISSGRIEIIPNKDGHDLAARLDLGVDKREIKRPFDPFKVLFALLNKDTALNGISAHASMTNEITKTMSFSYLDNPIGKASYTEEPGHRFIEITVPLEPGTEYADILYGCSLWATAHQAVADAYNPGILSQTNALTDFFVGQTGYGTVSDTQVALLDAITKYNRDQPNERKLRLDPSIIGAHLLRSEAVLPQMDYGEVADSVVRNKASSDSTVVKHGDIYLALIERLDGHRE